jgi:hypothetical protein
LVIILLILRPVQSKSEAERCPALYEATTQEELLAALELFASFPPVGTCTGLDDLSTEPASVEATVSPILECTFPNGGELGLCFLVEPGGWELSVASYLSLSSGGLGPAAYSGERIRPGDVLFTVNGQYDDLPTVEMEDGSYQLKEIEGPMVLQFSRPPPTTVGRPSGESSSEAAGSSTGRPQARTAKFPRSFAPKRRGGRKPERTRAEAQRARPVLPPGETVAEQAAALKEKLLTPEALEALWAEVESGEMGYMP